MNLKDKNCKVGSWLKAQSQANLFGKNHTLLLYRNEELSKPYFDTKNFLLLFSFTKYNINDWNCRVLVTAILCWKFFVKNESSVQNKVK